jgi:hypothetical protein
LLKANGEDVKTVQELLRHANSRITLDVYPQAVNSNKRAAQSKVVKMMVSNVGTRMARAQLIQQNRLKMQVKKLIVPRFRCHFRSIRPVTLLECVAGTTGLEPATSAVTAKRKRVTNRKQGATDDIFSALRKP